MNKLVSFCILLALAFTACKKYPDGPLLSLRSRTHRLVGTWEVESYIVDGIDSTDFLKSSPFYGQYQIKAEENGVGAFVYKNSSYGGSGHWYFENHQNYIRITRTNPISTSLRPFGGVDVTWEIRRLREKELWLKTQFNDKVYFVKFEQ